MYIEHLIYSAALAVIIGMIFSHFTGRDPSWIIVALAFVPDIDLPLERVPNLSRAIFSAAVHHGDFHNIVFLLGFSLLSAVVLRWFGIRFIDGFICSAIGIAAHLFEDALIADPAYAFLWPVTTQKFGIGIMQETRNLFGIASTTVLLIGIILLALAVLIRTLIEGTGWWRVFLRGGRKGTGSSG